MKKLKTGRVNVPFKKIEAFANSAHDPLVEGMTLSRKSAIYRCKNGSYTIQLHYKGAGSLSVTQTFKNVWLSYE